MSSSEAIREEGKPKDCKMLRVHGVGTHYLRGCWAVSGSFDGNTFVYFKSQLHRGDQSVVRTATKQKNENENSREHWRFGLCVSKAMDVRECRVKKLEEAASHIHKEHFRMQANVFMMF